MPCITIDGDLLTAVHELCQQRGYALDNGASVSLGVLNLTNSKSDQITDAYLSRLLGEPAEGPIDRVFHPVEPTVVRFTIAGRSDESVPAKQLQERKRKQHTPCKCVSEC